MLTQVLTHSQFSAALRTGHGRALQYVQTFGTTAIDDLLQNACLNNFVYDSQSENNRAAWLWQMLQISPQFLQHCSSIIKQLHITQNDTDLEQLFALTAFCMQHDIPHAKTVFMQRLQQEYQQKPWAWEGKFGEIRTESDLNTIVEQYAKFLRQSATDKPDLIPLINVAQTQASVCERIRKDHTVASILQSAAQYKSQYPSFYTQFGKCATVEELATIAQRLYASTDPDERLRLLRVFRRVPIPHLELSLFDDANAPSFELCTTALQVLALHQHSRVRKLALIKLHTGLSAEDDAVIGLLQRNYQRGDEQLIQTQLRALNLDEDQRHEWGWTLLNLSKANPDAPLADLLTWVYEYNPCGGCRASAIKALLHLNALAPALAQECLYDANNTVRALVQV